MPKILLTESDIASAVITLAEKIIEAHPLPALKNCAFIGILPRGVPIAKRVAHYIQKKYNVTIPVGQLEVSLYRDNIILHQTYVSLQETDIPFSTKNKTLILINDIFFEGKGVRAALNTLIDFDSPSRIEVGVILDRGHRKLPIYPDYVVKKIETKESDSIETKLFEINGEDSITINC
jgi:pyrimidine operon attenuation protein/uracil phosphoribosyltransferase